MLNKTDYNVVPQNPKERVCFGFTLTRESDSDH